MQIYKSEIKAGLQEAIAQDTVSISCDITPIDQSLIKPKENLQELILSVASANPNQPDLFYSKSILVSTGWNKNNDVFSKMHTWEARNTVIDKPVNLGHECLDIVGHMTNSYVMSNGMLIPDNTLAEELPQSFDILNEFVIYKVWRDEERQKQIDTLIQEILNNEWCVSMECKFADFDYAVITPDGEQYIVPRNESTACLSKHIKQFGGTGEFQGNRIGRLLKDLFFIGKGIVKRPANEKSVIINDTPNEMFNEANVKDSLTTESDTMAEDKMKEKDKEVECEKKEKDMAKSELESTKSELVEAKANILNLQAENQNLVKRVDELQGKISEKDTVIATLTDECKNAKAETISLAEKVKVMESTAKKSERANKLAKFVKASEIEATVNKFESLSDEMFEEVLKIYTPLANDETKVVKETVVDIDTSTASQEQNNLPSLPVEDKVKEANDNLTACAEFFGAIFKTKTK